MSNVAHHILAAAWSFTLVAGGLTLGAKIWLGRRLDQLNHPVEFDSTAVYMGLVVPGVLPVAWLASGLLHLEVSGALVEACCSILALPTASWQQWVFGAGAAVLAAVQGRALWERWRPRHRSHRTTSVDAASERVAQICRDHCHLSRLEGRIRVVDCRAHVCATVGLFNQRVEIAASLVERLDDQALEAALLHEAAHASLYDPARGFVLLASQVMNPFSWALSREASAWRFAREVVCDRHAVASGARPVSVADALVSALRATSSAGSRECARRDNSVGQPARADLCGGGMDALTARVNLLLNDKEPAHTCQDFLEGPAIGSAVLAVGLLAPHLLGARLISIHCVIEETLKTLTFAF